MSKVKQRPSDDLTAFERYQELNPKQVAKFIGVSTTRSVWRYVDQGKLPKPRYLSPHKAIWRLGEVIDHTHMLMQTPSKAVQGFKGEGLATDATKNSSTLNKLKKRLGLR